MSRIRSHRDFGYWGPYPVWDLGYLIKRGSRVVLSGPGPGTRCLRDRIDEARSITPPSDAQRIHDLVLQSGDAWTVALDNVALFCETGKAFYNVPAALKFWESALALQEAGNRFLALVVTEEVQEWVRR